MWQNLRFNEIQESTCKQQTLIESVRIILILFSDWTTEWDYMNSLFDKNDGMFTSFKKKSIKHLKNSHQFNWKVVLEVEYQRF